jgi:hypothetical protein
MARFLCPDCSATYEVKERPDGKPIRCRICGRRGEVSGPGWRLWLSICCPVAFFLLGVAWARLLRP